MRLRIIVAIIDKLIPLLNCDDLKILSPKKMISGTIQSLSPPEFSKILTKLFEYTCLMKKHNGENIS